MHFIPLTRLFVFFVIVTMIQFMYQDMKWFGLSYLNPRPMARAKMTLGRAKKNLLIPGKINKRSLVILTCFPFLRQVQGQRLVYKFHKLPYAYKPVKYNWPWRPPVEDNSKPEKPDIVSVPVSLTTHWPLMSMFHSNSQPQRQLSAPANHHYSCLECTPRTHGPTVCRSQIMFPPCSCRGSAVYGCGLRMLHEPSSMPVQVITRFVQ